MSTEVAERVDLGLTGMTCAACATRIEKVLNRLPGVTATVNFATETASVGFDPARADADALVAAVARAGYGARVRRDVEEDRRQDAARKASELRTLERELIVAAVLTAPLLLMMIPMVTGAHHEWLPRWAQLALATPVQFWIGRRFYVGAWHALRGGGANMDVLVVLGTTLAYVWSAVVTARGLDGQHVYFESAAAVITLVFLGKVMESRARAGTSAALEGLLRLAPKTAHVVRDGAAVDVPLVPATTRGCCFTRRCTSSVTPARRNRFPGTMASGSSTAASPTGEFGPAAAGARCSPALRTRKKASSCEEATGVGSAGDALRARAPRRAGE